MEEDFTQKQWNIIDKQKDEAMMYVKAAHLSLYSVLPNL
jgi:hypothetical protein